MFWLVCCVLLWSLPAQTGLAALPPSLKTSEQVYQNPFDLAGGGASLTRATQEGVLFSNPSLSAFGSGFLRWVYGRTAYHVGAAAADFVIDKARNGGAGSLKVDADLLKKAIKTPIHAGVDVSAGTILANGGAAVFATTRADLEGRQFGSEGLPELRARVTGLAGAVTSGAKEFNDVLAIGVATKYLYNAEFVQAVGLDELQQAKSLPAQLKERVKRGFGLGFDAGATLQARSKLIDMRLAAVVNDIGGTKFRGNVTAWKQTLGLGLGVTLHSRKQALHCSADLRDVQAAYGEHWTRRAYAGCKALFTNYIGLAAGFHQGWPSYGVILNLFILRLEAGSYTREFGRQAGTIGRRVYFAALGLDLL